MNRMVIFATAMSLLLVTAGGLPVTATADSTLSVDVDQARDGEVQVSVTLNGSAVENASVEIDAGNDTYAGTGSYETNENGTVHLPAPNQTVTVNVTATTSNKTGTETVTLSAPRLAIAVNQAPDGTALVRVTYSITSDPAVDANVSVSTDDANDTYAGVGEHETDDNGTFTLPPPQETTAIRLEATAGDIRGSANVILLNATDVGDTYENFGARVSAYVHYTLGNHQGGIGQMVADFVTTHNPGNPPDHAGPPNDGEHGPPGFVEDRSTGGNVTENDAADGQPVDDGGPPARANDDADDGDDHPGQGNAHGR